MFGLIREIVQRRELLGILVARNVKIRYKGSALGFLWTLLNPVFFIVIYATFLGLLKVPIGLSVLVIGTIVWSFFDMCMSDSLYAIIGNANLVKKSAFPRIILPIAMVASNLFNFMLALGVLAIFLLYKAEAAQYVWLLPFVILTHTALCLGVALIVSTLNTYFRDTEHIVTVGKLAWFFMTPIIYPLDFLLSGVPEKLHVFAMANPMTGVVTAYRWILMSGDPVAPRMVMGSCFSCWLILVIGVVVFQRNHKGFADVL